ncbi:MAG: hypothetical protein KJ749_04510 [Planctomycetes bacterium]|nr:hypothetical protein [Planctomycetota bacterium]
MKRAMCVMLVLGFVPIAALADEEKDAKPANPALEILKKVDAACKALKSVKYDVTGSADGAMAARFGAFEASIDASGRVSPNQRTPGKYKFDVKFTLPGTTEPIHLSGGTDSEVFFVVHHKDKTAYEDIDPAVMGQAAGVLPRIMIIEYLFDEPFSDEINGKQQELKGSKTIGGEDCHEIHVIYQAEGAPEATWCFSKKDYLPRQRIDHYTLPNGEKGTVTKTATNVVANPKFADDDFKLKLPEDYTKTDDFAPDIFPRQNPR